MLASALIWITAAAAVLTLYANALLSLRTGAFTTGQGVSAIFGAVMLAGVAGLALIPRDPALPRSRVRPIPTWLFLIALGGFSISTLGGFMDRAATLQDLAIFALVSVMPLLLWRVQDVGRLIAAIGTIAIGVALADAAANWLAKFGIVNLVVSGRSTESGMLLVRLPGLSGNTHAGGLVCFLALLSLAYRFPKVERFWVKIATLAGIVLLFSSLQMIDARRYLGAAMVGVAILLYPKIGRRIPNLALLIAVPALFLYANATSNAHDYGNVQRAQLMEIGMVRAREHPVFGEGAFYRNYVYQVNDTRHLAVNGVTESGVLDLAIQYGALFAAMFLVAAALAASAPRKDLKLEPLILTLFTAEFAYGYVLEGFLGSLVFFSALVFCLKDRDYSYSPRKRALRYAQSNMPTGMAASPNRTSGQTTSAPSGVRASF